jgi:S-adenosylmethionine synthetase
MVDTFGTSEYSNEAIADAVVDIVDLRPAAIIERFDLRKPIYAQLAAYGHMGREDLGVAWEKTDIANDIKKALAE